MTEILELINTMSPFVLLGFLLAGIMHAFVPDLYEALGVFLSLIVVNCIILARAEAFASKNNVLLSALDGLGMGVGFTLALTVIATVRELLATGSFFEISLFGENFAGASVMIMAPGGFLTLGIIIAIMNAIKKRNKGGDAQ